VSELGDFLRARRGSLQPADVGLPARSGSRRTPGLRREELAAIAGLSIDYYIRLEQGKETNPSVAILTGLARALQLGDDETAYLHALAGHVVQPASAPPQRARVRPGIVRLLETLRPCPAYVLSRTSDVLASNPEGMALFAGMLDWPPERRNTARYIFLHPNARTVVGDWERSAVMAASHLRMLVATDPAAPDLAALVEELSAYSAEFAELWKRHHVGRRRSDLKTFHHPWVGDITLMSESLQLGDDGQRMTIYQAEPGSADHDAMTLLSLMASEGAGSAR
jgi:transcriptional regulator with XRE-family HTH domain